MQEKFTYFDAIAFVVPGSVLVGGGMLIFSLLGISVPQLENTVLGTVSFLIAAFITGHLVSAFAQWTYQDSKSGLFKDGLISQLFLVKYPEDETNPYCTDEWRSKIISIALKKGFLSQAEHGALDKPASLEKAKAVSHGLFERYHTLITDEAKGERARVANAYAVFFRNLSMTFKILAVLLSISLLTLFFQHLKTRSDSFADNMTLCSLLLCVSLVAIWTFKKRYKERSYLHVKNVFDSATSLLLRSEEADGTVSQDIQVIQGGSD